MGRTTQVHFGEPPRSTDHEWVAEWMHHEHDFRNLRYRCARCFIGPYTAAQISLRVNAACFGRRGY